MASVDEQYILETLRLAERGRGKVSPNPMVGAIITRQSQVIARGYHRKFGGPHAEIDALRQAQEDVSGATLYVNLEPCVHHGKTAPCAEAVLRAGIGRVVVGSVDPNPLVSGAGVKLLRKNGVDVITGVCEENCRQLNKGFYSRMERGRPAVTIKAAQTLDGKISRGTSKRDLISSEESQRYVHKLRARHDAILIGRRTAELDNPLLTVRHGGGASPRRIVLDSRLHLPLSLQMFQPEYAENTIVLTTSAAPPHRKQMLEKANVTVIKVRSNAEGFISLTQALNKLGDMDILTLLVEGGGQVIQSFFKSQLVDDLHIITAPKVFGEGLALFQRTFRPEINVRKVRRLGPDIIMEAEVTANG
jgi:diaminohydroxyphosphoribosylaminopyrimidine deaminase / 5-amino-6-(5-phosphoribosylamino)uracil reductase